jgi:hypothetical protein
MTLLIAGCMSSGPKSEEARAVCDVWGPTIVVTEREDPRRLREQELLARETHRAVCR